MDNKTRELILEVLGSRVSVGRGQLVAITEQTDRTNREVIAELVMRGIPIAGGQGGYRLLRTSEECEREILKLRSYVFSLFRRLRGLRRARDQYDRGGLLQLKLFA